MSFDNAALLSTALLFTFFSTLKNKANKKIKLLKRRLRPSLNEKIIGLVRDVTNIISSIINKKLERLFFETNCNSSYHLFVNLVKLFPNAFLLNAETDTFNNLESVFNIV